MSWITSPASPTPLWPPASPVKVPRDRVRGRSAQRRHLPSNGEAVTAADVVAVIEANKANATYKDMLSFIETVAAKDDATVSFTLAYPFVDSDKQLKRAPVPCAASSQLPRSPRRP